MGVLNGRAASRPPAAPLEDPELELIRAHAHDRGSRIMAWRLALALLPLVVLLGLFTGAVATLFL